MKQLYLFCLLWLIAGTVSSQGVTVIPNSDFETWINYSNYQDPQYWDTPNQELASIPLFGTTVVDKSTDHESGSYSARLETKNITLVGNVPGFMTLGNLTIDVFAGTYTITGGVPVYDKPTHLKGYFKFQPKGGDSCAMGIGLTRFSNGVRDTIGYGYFSTHDTVNDWTPFSAWIDYDTVAQPDTMNILIFSSAMELPTAGTVLFVDDLYLDYTVSVDPRDASSGLDFYNDRETRRLLVFLDFPTPQPVEAFLYDMRGIRVAHAAQGYAAKGRIVLPYSGISEGIYLLEVIHGGQKFTRKYYLAGR
jgi:hypothetical protein